MKNSNEWIIIDNLHKNLQDFETNWSSNIDQTTRPSGYQQKEDNQDLDRELKKTIEEENDSDTYCNWRTWYGYQMIFTETGELKYKRPSKL